MSNGFTRSNCPPPKSNVIWVEAVKGGERHRFTLYSPAVWGFDTHWTGKKTVPCYEDHSLCEGGHSIETLRWKGYFYAFSHKRNKPVFVQITDECWRGLVMQIAEGTSFRGLTVDIARTQSNKGRLSAQVVTYAMVDVTTLPRDEDPQKSLEHFWKVKPLDCLLSRSWNVQAETLPMRQMQG